MKLPSVTLAGFAGLFLSWVVYWLAVYVYRAYFSPLAKFPGPRLAAATYWYEFYYELWPHQYQYLWKIKELHERYGPIVRINPGHLHIDDQAYYDAIYARWNRKRNPETIDHDLHRERRRAIDPLFSKRSVQALENMILGKIDKLMERFRDVTKDRGQVADADAVSGGVVNLTAAMAGLTMDVIAEYCFGPDVFNALREPEFGGGFVTVLRDGVKVRPVGRQFPALINFIVDLPEWLAHMLNPATGKMVALRDKLKGIIDPIFAGERETAKGYRTVLHELTDKELPEGDKELDRMVANVMVFMGAGTETTARTLAVTYYYLLKQPEALARLRDEIGPVFAASQGRPSTAKLEGLPYLCGIINEGLRVSHGVSSRLPRVPTDENLTYREWTIPKGTAIMQSSYLVHTHPDYFPDPFDFKPQRWLENPGLIRYLVAFSKGSRACVGINLAYAELYLTIAHLAHCFDMELYDTLEERDVFTNARRFLGLHGNKLAGDTSQGFDRQDGRLIE